VGSTQKERGNVKGLPEGEKYPLKLSVHTNERRTKKGHTVEFEFDEKKKKFPLFQGRENRMPGSQIKKSKGCREISRTRFPKKLGPISSKKKGSA